MKKLTVLITMLVLLSAWGKPIATAQGMTTNVINGGNLRTEPRLAPETILGQVCPGDQVEVLTQQQALGALWYRVRITNTVLDCHSKRVPLNSEGWLSSSLLAPPQLGTPSSLPSPNPTAIRALPSPTPTAPSSPASFLSVIQRGNLRTEIVLTPKTVIGKVCPGGIVELMDQQQALGELWYRVRLTKMGPACADQESMTLGKEGWLNSTLVGPFQTPTPTATSSQIPTPTATSDALLRADAKGLLVHYSFDRPAQAGKLLDDSEMGNDARAVGDPQYVAYGHFGGAYAFSQGNYFAAAQNPTAGLAAFTVALWFKTDDPLKNYKLASAATWNGGPGSGWVIGTHYPELWSEDGASIKLDGCDFGSLRLFKAKEWNHLVLTYDSSKLKGYINGQLVRDCGNSGQPLGSGTKLNVGSWNGFPFVGLLDDFRIYNRAISAEEVGQLGDFAPLSKPNRDLAPTATSATLSPAGATAAGDSRPASSTFQAVWKSDLCDKFFLIFFWFLVFSLFNKAPLLFLSRIFLGVEWNIRKIIFELGSKPGKSLPEVQGLTTAEAFMLLDDNKNKTAEAFSLLDDNKNKFGKNTEAFALTLKELLIQRVLELQIEEEAPQLGNSSAFPQTKPNPISTIDLTKPNPISTIDLTKPNPISTIDLSSAITTGLIVHYPFSHPTQAGKLLDESGMGNDARAVGKPQYVADESFRFGGAYALSGSYFAAAQNPTAGLAAFTVALWFKTDDPLKNYKLASAATWNNGSGSGWVIGTHYPELWSDNGASIKLGDGDFGSHRLFKANEWNHVVLTYDSSKPSLKGYINGQLVLDSRSSGLPIGNGTQLKVGAWMGFPFVGLIKDFRIYNRAISAEEVGQLIGNNPIIRKSIRLAPEALHQLPSSSPLYKILTLLATCGARESGLTLKQMENKAQENFKVENLYEFQEVHIMVTLVERGLLEMCEVKNLWSYRSYKIYRFTQSGKVVSQQLKAQLDQARLIPQLLENNPAQATELILSLGNLLLLVNELKPHYARLATILHDQQYSILETFDRMMVDFFLLYEGGCRTERGRWGKKNWIGDLFILLLLLVIVLLRSYRSNSMAAVIVYTVVIFKGIGLIRLLLSHLLSSSSD